MGLVVAQAMNAESGDGCDLVPLCYSKKHKVYRENGLMGKLLFFKLCVCIWVEEKAHKGKGSIEGHMLALKQGVG